MLWLPPLAGGLVAPVGSLTLCPRPSGVPSLGQLPEAF